MSPHEQLGVMIREARLEKSMSLGQLASAVGRSSSSVRRWERGEVAPAASVLPKLSAILEIDIQSLLGDQATSAGSKEESSQDKAVDERISTVEQPVIADSEPQAPIPQDVPTVPPSSEGGRLSSLWDSVRKGGQGWMGWIRGALTVVALVVMLFVLVWALGELFSALGSVLDSFDVGSNGG
ncbi:MAG: helix-turn-helix transcriptional regulator [Actinomycetia bacterium]|nr:helix-turn-helix transcriptional regulator [Actinomycetes bacterium]